MKIGEYFFAEHFAVEAPTRLTTIGAAIKYEKVDAMFQWRRAIRDELDSMIATARGRGLEILARHLVRIAEDVLVDDAESIRVYEVPRRRDADAPDSQTVIGFVHRRSKIRLALEALASSFVDARKETSA